MSESYDKLPKVLDCVSLVDDPQLRGIITARLWGQSSAEIGRQLNITRETVRRRCRTALNQMRRKRECETGCSNFYEDKYVTLFFKYNISSREIAYCFKEPVSTQAFLDVVKIGMPVGGRNDREPLENVLYDVSIDPELRKVLVPFIRGMNHVFVYDIETKRSLVAVAVATLKYVAPRELTLREIIEEARRGLLAGGMSNTDSFYKKYRLITQNMRDAENVMTCSGNTFRYYDFSSVNSDELIADFGLLDYDGLAISTQLLVQRHPESLEKYNLANAIQLHNLLRHVLADNPYYSFGRMPVIYIGNANKEKQLGDLAKEHYMTRAGFVNLCNSKYGFSPIIVYNVIRKLPREYFKD